MSVQIQVPDCIEGFFSKLMEGHMIDDDYQVVDLPTVLNAIVRREENEALAGLKPKDGYKCPLRVQWEITNICNLACTFCYNSDDRANKKVLSRDAAWDVAHQIVEMDTLDVALSGGELFTDWEFVNEVGQFFTKHGLGVHLVTNGWFTTDDHIRELKKWNLISVQVSIDGAAEAVHDAVRGKRGSWRRAVRSARMFVEAGFFTTVGCALTRTNCHTIEDLLQMCMYMGVDRVIIGDLLLVGGGGRRTREELWLDSRTFEQCAQKIWKFASRSKDMIDVLIAKDPGFSIANTLLTKPAALVVRYDGTVIPHCLIALPIGDLKEESLQAIWDRIGGNYLENDTIVEALKYMEVTLTPELNLVRTLYSPEAEALFL